MVLTGIIATIGTALSALAIVAAGGFGVAITVWVSIVIGLSIYALVPT